MSADQPKRIPLPERWYDSVKAELLYFVDGDPGDEDPSSGRHVVLVTEWRRVE